MSKWIAEFELEDGDIMPEHMDLHYKGANIDFHCKPLEQEPFINKSCVSSGVCEHDKNKVLDKIRAEIADIADADAYGDYQQGFNFGLMRAAQIIGKYEVETEDT